ncbi:hypothetical protein Tco_1368755 [Tanacetum coccineum]
MEEKDDEEIEEEDDEEIEDEEEEEIYCYEAREILKDIGKVYPFGPVPPMIGTAMRRIRKLNELKRERVEVEKRIMKKIDRSDLRTRMAWCCKECQADVSKVISMKKSMSLEFDRARNAAMADNDVVDDDVKDEDDMDDDAAEPSDPQSSEPRVSPLDSQ